MTKCARCKSYNKSVSIDARGKRIKTCLSCRRKQKHTYNLDSNDDRRKSQSKDCNNVSICEHGRIKGTCYLDGNKYTCQHDRRLTQCKICNSASLCIHGNIKGRCKLGGDDYFCRHEKRAIHCGVCNGFKYEKRARISKSTSEINPEVSFSELEQRYQDSQLIKN